MNSNQNKREFRLVEIEVFDARKGYNRASVPSIDVHIGGAKVSADFWRDKNGRLVLRFSCQGYNYHFEGLLASGENVPEERLEEFMEFVEEMLLEWFIEGVDDLPSSIYD